MVNVAFVRRGYSCCGDRVRANCLMLRALVFLSVFLLMFILPIKDSPGLELISSGGTASSPDLQQPGSRLGGYAVSTSNAALYGLRMMGILAQAAPGVEPAGAVKAEADAGSPLESPAAKEMSVRVLDVLTGRPIPGAAISRERIIRQVVQAEESGKVTFREPPEEWEIKITADGYDSVTERLPWEEEVTIFLLPSEATVRFKVTAKDSGAPVEGAILNLSVDDKKFPEARTDADGACSTRDKPKVGKWSVDIKAGGFIALKVDFEKFPGLKDPTEIQLQRDVLALRFHVFEEKSRGPVRNALVQLRREDWLPDTFRSQPTDFEGCAEFRNVDWSKGWTVSVQRADYFPYRGNVVFKSISPDNVCPNDIPLAPEKKVKFCLWDNITRKPSPKIEVTVQPPSQTKATDDNGFAEFTINPNKACEVSITARGYEPLGITWSYGQETDLKLQQLPPEPVSFSLKNKKTGEAMPGVKVAFSRAGMDSPIEATADTNGVVEFKDNLHFVWQVHVEAEEFWPLDVPAWTRGGETTLQLEPAIIRAEFLIKDGIVADKPISGATVSLSAEGQKLEGTTDEKGQAVFKINPRLKWRLTVTADGYAALQEDWKPVEKTEREIVRADRKAEFSVMDRITEKPVPGATVTLTHPNPRLSPVQATTDQEGIALIELQPYPGWELAVAADGYAPLKTAWGYAEGTLVQIELAPVKAEFSVKDRVTEKAVPGAAVTLTHPNPRLTPVRAITDERGIATSEVRPYPGWEISVGLDRYMPLKKPWEVAEKTPVEIELAAVKAEFSVKDRITEKAVPGAGVMLTHPNPRLSPIQATTDQDGIARIEVQPYPGWELAVAADGYPPLKRAWEYAEKTVVEIELAPVKAEFSVRDRITGKAVPVAIVTLSHPNPRLSPVQATTDENGSVVIEVQRYPGWELSVAADRYAPEKRAWDGAEKTLVEIELARTRVEFFVKDGFTDEAIPGAVVELSHEKLGSMKQTTDPNGLAVFEIQPYPGWQVAVNGDLTDKGYSSFKQAFEGAPPAQMVVRIEWEPMRFPIVVGTPPEPVPGAKVRFSWGDRALEGAADQAGVAAIRVPRRADIKWAVTVEAGYKLYHGEWTWGDESVNVKPGIFRFIVADGVSGKAIPAALVELSRDGRVVEKGTTDQNGGAEVEINPGLPWRVEVKAEGYAPLQESLAPPLKIRLELELAPLKATFLVKDHITEKPVPGATVMLTHPNPLLSPVQATTDQNGVAVFAVKPYPGWELTLAADGYPPLKRAWEYAEKTVVEIELAPVKAEFSVKDRVTEKAVPGATVTLTHPNPPLSPVQATTDQNGVAEFALKPYPGWELAVAADGYPPLKRAWEYAEKTVVEIELAPVKAEFSVKDRVTEKAVPGATVTLTHPNPRLSPVQATTDENGSVVIEVKPYPGWEISVALDRYTPVKKLWDVAEKTPIEVELAAVKAEFSIKDRITEKAVPGATVALTHSNELLAPLQGTTDDNGAVVLEVKPYPGWEITAEAKGYKPLEKKGWEWAQETVLSLIPIRPPRVQVLLNWSYQWTGSQSISWLRGEMMALAKALSKPEGGQLQAFFLARGKEKEWPADLVARGEFPPDLPVASAVDLPANVDWILSAEGNLRDFVLITWPDQLMDEGSWGDSLRQKYNREPAETLRGASLIVIQIGGERVGLLSNALGDERYKVVKARESGTIVKAALPWLLHRVAEPGFVMESGSKEVFNHPFGVAVDSMDNVLVADSSNHRIRRLDSLGRLEGSWGEVGSADGNLRSPHGVAIDRAGNVLVADTGNHRIQKFDSSGRFLSRWGKFGSGDGEFNEPSALVADSSGNVFVADFLNHRIQKFDPSGAFEARWGEEGSGDGQFRHPCGIAVNSCGMVFVADTWNHRIQTFDASGKFLGKWGSPGSDGGQFNLPCGIAIDSWGDIWVADYGNHRVQVFDSSGRFIQQYGSEGSEKGEFLRPGAVAVDSAGNVFASDTGNHRIQKFGPFLDAPYAVGALFAVTGSASWLGEPEKKTAEMIAEQINAAGGIRGHPLRLIVEDTGAKEAEAVSAITKLIDSDRVCAVIGPSTSGETLALINIADEYKVPLISCGAAAPIVQPVEDRKWVFKVPQMDSDCVRRIYDYIRGKGWTKVAIITTTTGFGRAGREQLLNLAGEYGIEIVADESYSPRDTDMTVQLTKIKNTDAQALINWAIEQAQCTVLKNAKQLGLTMQLFQSHGFGNPVYVELAGEAAEGVIFPGGALLAPEVLPEDHPQKDVVMRFKSEYEAKYNEPVSTFGGHAHDALHLVIEALKEVGPDRARIRQYIENKKGFVGTAGVFNFSPNDHCGLDKTAFVMYTVENQRFELAPVPPGELLPGEIKVVVKKGETLSDLSRKYGASVETICKRNNIGNPSLVREGRELIITLPETKQLKTRVLTYHRPGESKGYFRLVVQANPNDKDPGVIPKDIVFVIDSSKSITQRKLSAYAEGVKLCLRNLYPQDRFNVVEFKNFSHKFSPEDVVPATAEARSKAEEFLSNLVSEGGTNVHGALAELVTQQPTPGRPRIIFLVSDGRPTAGIRTDSDIINEVTRLNDLKSSVFTFAGGEKINASLLDLLSYRNRGARTFERDDRKIADTLVAFFNEFNSPILLNPRFNFGSIDPTEVYPKVLPDLCLNGKLEMCGRFRSEDEFSVQLLGETDSVTKEYVLQQTLTGPDNGDESVASLWALRKTYDLVSLMVQQGGAEATLAEIHQLSAQYKLETPYSPYR